jgi:hypothetical protein
MIPPIGANLIGYGLLEDGKPRGIWPMPLEILRQAKKRYVKNSLDSKIQIVPIYIGDPITEATNERHTFAGKK